jgi:hypothetical protein
MLRCAECQWNRTTRHLATHWPTVPSSSLHFILTFSLFLLPLFISFLHFLFRRSYLTTLSQLRNIKKVKNKAVPLHAMKALGGERRYSSYPFTTSALDRGEWSSSRPGRALPPGKGPEARGKIICPCRESNPDRPVVQPVVRGRPSRNIAYIMHNVRMPLEGISSALRNHGTVRTEGLRIETRTRNIRTEVIHVTSATGYRVWKPAGDLHYRKRHFRFIRHSFPSCWLLQSTHVGRRAENNPVKQKYVRSIRRFIRKFKQIFKRIHQIISSVNILSVTTKLSASRDWSQTECPGFIALLHHCVETGSCD